MQLLTLAWKLNIWFTYFQFLLHTLHFSCKKNHLRQIFKDGYYSEKSSNLCLSWRRIQHDLWLTDDSDSQIFVSEIRTKDINAVWNIQSVLK